MSFLGLHAMHCLASAFVYFQIFSDIIFPTLVVFNKIGQVKWNHVLLNKPWGYGYVIQEKYHTALFVEDILKALLSNVKTELKAQCTD